MRKIILLRHAKSSWDDTALDDHDRPLNKRGKAAAPVIARWLADRGHHPDVILCSSSTRTRETVRHMRKIMPGLPEPVIERELYHAAPGAMLDRLRRLPPECGSVMLVGHQPGLGALLRQLADGTENRRCRRAYEHFPTAAAAVVAVDLADWSDLADHCAGFIDFAKPRELMNA